jgi:cell wall-associated NlpC family hydrolase
MPRKIGHAEIGDHGLLNAHRVAEERIKRLILRGAMLGVRHAPQIHYTQQPARWQGIDKRRRSYKGQFPTQADCSSFVTWLLWDATLAYDVRDFVNGQLWKAGHTGSLVTKGREVGGRLRIGDLVFYGDEGWRPGHVAIVVRPGTLRGGAKVVSFGSEPGPFLLPADYRDDVARGGWAPRRYFH